MKKSANRHRHADPESYMIPTDGNEDTGHSSGSSEPFPSRQYTQSKNRQHEDNPQEERRYHTH